MFSDFKTCNILFYYYNWGMARPEWTYKYQPEELEAKIKDYFDSITISKPRTKQNTDPDKDVDDDFREPILNDLWEQIVDKEYVEIPSILWMCEYLGIVRTTLLEYEAKHDYLDTIKVAKQRIEKYNAEQLYRTTQVTGIIFNLKNNFDWKDKTEVDNNTKLSVVWDVLSSIWVARPDLTQTDIV